MDYVSNRHHIRRPVYCLLHHYCSDYWWYCSFMGPLDYTLLIVVLQMIKRLSIGIAVIVLSLLYFYYPASDNHFYPGCALYSLTHFYCPACGGQRAFSALLHGQFLLALQNNLLLVVALFFFLVLFALYLRNHLFEKGKKFTFTPSPFLLWTILAVIVAFWLLRNIPLKPFIYLAPINS